MKKKQGKMVDNSKHFCMKATIYNIKSKKSCFCFTFCFANWETFFLFLFELYHQEQKTPKMFCESHLYETKGRGTQRQARKHSECLAVLCCTSLFGGLLGAEMLNSLQKEETKILKEKKMTMHVKNVIDRWVFWQALKLFSVFQSK